MCLVRDKDEMLPLHFAAMRGRVEVIRELIKAKPNSIREMTETDDGSVLHLSIRYNHLEALKLRVESLRDDHHFLSLKDKEDNSLLHLAVKRRQIKVLFIHKLQKVIDSVPLLVWVLVFFIFSLCVSPLLKYAIFLFQNLKFY